MNKFTITGAVVLAIIASCYGWIKQNGDFATVSYVQEAKAATLEQVRTNYPSRYEFETLREDMKYVRSKIDKALEK